MRFLECNFQTCKNASDIFRSSHENALRWIPQGITDDKSILVQVMAWCHQAMTPSHYLSQRWPRSLSPYITRPQWNNLLRANDAYMAWWNESSFIIGSDNGRTSLQQQAINWNRVNLLSIDILFQFQCTGINFCGLVMPYGDIDLGQHWLRK